MSTLSSVQSSTTATSYTDFRQRIDSSGVITGQAPKSPSRPPVQNNSLPPGDEAPRRTISHSSLSVADESRLYASAGIVDVFIPTFPIRDGRKNSGEMSKESGRQATEVPSDVKGQKGTAGDGAEQDPRIQQVVASLRAIEAKVKAHEAAHKAAGGTMAGPVQYSYSRGPDGKTYITGGEVSISASPGKTPQETARRMDQVVRAALAPVDPSPQDMMVAAQAAVAAAQARLQASAEVVSTENTGQPVDTSQSVAAAAKTTSESPSRTLPGERASTDRDSYLSSIPVKRYSDPAVTGRLQANEESRNRFSEAVSGLLRGFFPSLPISLYA